MQQDTRRITVAIRHLRSAREEVTLALGQTEQSIADAAVARALNHLELAWRRLDQQRERTGRDAVGAAVERAYASARHAWQGVHDVQNDPRSPIGSRLNDVHSHLLVAIAALQEICGSDELEQDTESRAAVGGEER